MLKLALTFFLIGLVAAVLGFTGIADSDWEDIVRLYRVHRVAASNREAVKMAVLAGIERRHAA